MTQWHELNVGDAMLAGAELQRLECAFDLTYPANSRVWDTALFIRHVSEGQLHCDVIVYFTPATVKLARRMHAIPRSAPIPDGLGLLKGDSAAWRLFGHEAWRT